MINTSKCLHIPPLYEEGTAEITWEPVDGAQGYELDIVFNEDFESASHGLSWANIENREYTWQDAQDADLSWQELGEIPSVGATWQDIQLEAPSWEDIEAVGWTWTDLHEQPARFTVYRGEGRPAPAPDQGLSWANLETMEMTWQDAQDAEWDWQSLALQPSVGLNWSQLEEEGFSWQDIQLEAPSWKEIEFLPTRGLTWSSLQGRCMTWEDIETQELSWQDLSQLPPDNTTLAACTVDIPLYKKKAQLRVRSMGEEEERSDYLTSGLIDTLPRSLAKYMPPCLHLPEKIYEEGNATITWGDLYGASGFVIERQVNGGEYEEVFHGQGEAVALSCDILDGIRDVETHYCATVEIPFYAKTVAFQVKAYNTTDESQYITSATVKTLSRSLAKYKVPCLHLPTLYEGKGADISWGDLYGASGYTLEWGAGGSYEPFYDGPGKVIPHPAGCTKPAEHANGPDCKTHLAHTGQVPYNQKTLGCRIQGHNTTDSSQYLESAQVAVIPLFYREDNINLAVTAGQVYRLVLLAKDIENPSQVIMTVEYDAATLRLDTVGKRAGLASNATLPADAEIVSNTAGALKLKCMQSVESGVQWSGAVTALDFTAIKTGTATVKLS